MPIFEQGYQHWNGRLAGHAWRWLAITRRGVRAQLRRKSVVAVVLIAWMPALLLAAALAVWGLIEQKSSLITPYLAMLRELPRELLTDPHFFRSAVWTMAFDMFFRFETSVAMILVLLVGPELISQDLRFNAMPLYFAKPLRRFDYLLGKLGVIGAFLAAVMLLPSLLAYGLGIGFSLDLGVLHDTGRVLVAGISYSLLVIVSAGTLMLALSSLSRSSRHVGALWLGLWIVSNMLASILGSTIRQDWCPLFSYTHNLSRVCGALLDTGAARAKAQEVFEGFGRGVGPPPWLAEHPGAWSVWVLVGLLGLSLWILHLRVKTLDKLG